MKLGTIGNIVGEFSRPRKGAWIEITKRLSTFAHLLVAPARGRGLKSSRLADQIAGKLSPPQGGVD